MAEHRAAFYAARPGGLRDWWTLLHPPYTAWHLAYVAIGAALAPHLDGVRLGATVLAFFAAVGVGAHAVDELQGRPLQTKIGDRALIAAAVVAVLVAVAIGAAGVARVGWVLVPFIVVGPALVVAYNAEVFGGVVHTDAGFALAWGAFPVLTAYAAQAGGLSWPVGLAAAGAAAVSYAQRALSTPARLLRRRARQVHGAVEFADAEPLPLDQQVLLLPLERALRALSWGVVAFAAAAVAARL
ncbi:MAG TPA: hypothetical protein VFA11_09575 [Acidimicrobiales bacterium]|nr:hypothetical protein [Acidimicrobiales bacterium]